jgi:hypothetical protein
MEETWVWPEWVPEELCKSIENFWCHALGRGPAQWRESARQSGAPELGEIATLRTLRSWSTFATGKYVHAWNNIGRIVHDDGSFSYVSVNR